MQMSSDGAWSWHPEHVKMGQAVLGPTYRLMKLDTVIEVDDVRIFVDCTSGARLCKHGELGTTISTWKTLAAAAVRDGKPPPERKSICDCTSTWGLNKKVDVARIDVEQPTIQRIFWHLAELDTPKIIVEGHEARQLPFSSGDAAAFLRSDDGRIVCRHGRLRASLLHMKTAGHHARCSCMPMGFPMRKATRALSAPEKRKSAAKRKRAGEAAKAAQEPAQDAQEAQEAQEPPPPEATSGLSAMSNKELKQLVLRAGGSLDGCIEKEDLLHLAKQANEALEAEPAEANR